MYLRLLPRLITMSNTILLNFGEFSLTAKLFDTQVARQFIAHLPCEIPLTTWGDEAYGPIGIDLGEENPVPDIPPGGLAYTNQGNYFCIFYGQRPAWAVEYIGKIEGNEWQRLSEERIRSVEISVDTSQP